MALKSSAAVSMVARPLSLKFPDGQRPRLLLAEDCEPVRIVTAAMLKGMGCDVDAVVHGEQAVQSASEQKFDVIVLDIEMPIMDGITAARSIRRMGGVAGETPLMALSAFLADSMRTGQWRDTFDIALPKPANKNELHDAVKTALQWQHTAGQRALPAELPPILDLVKFEGLRNGITAPVWQELRATACRDIALCINQLEYVASGRQDGAILALAGKLRNMGQTFAAPRMSRMAQKVQMASSEDSRRTALAGLLETAGQTLAAMNS
jgi:CheY-like chemotaxis protein